MKWLIVSLLVCTCHCLTASPAFHLNDKLMQTASHTIHSSTYYSNTAYDSVGVDTFNFIFSRSHSTYRSLLAIQSIDYDIDSQRINITVDTCASLPTHVQVCLYSSTLSKLKGITIRLMLFSGGLNKIYLQNINYAPLSPFSLTTTTHVQFTVNLPSQNLGSTYIKFGILNGVNAVAPTSANLFDFRVTVVMLTWTQLQVKVNTQVLGTTTVNSFKIGYFGYNQNDMNSGFPRARAKYYNYEMTLISSFINTFSSTPLAGYCQSFNTFWGVYRFRIGNQPFLTFTTTLNPLVSIPASSTYVLNNLYIVVIAFQIYACQGTTPYYMAAQTLCYDTCPDRHYQNDMDYLCSSCPYDCLRCNSNGTCSSCNSATDFRTLQAGRCVPLPGYFDSGANNTVAQSCSGSCRTCANSASFCTGCNNGSGLTPANACSACSQNCTLCQASYTVCTQCALNYRLHNNSCHFGYDCTLIVNCTVCNTTNGCSQCDLGLVVLNDSVTCVGVCGDGLWLFSQGCDDGNNVNGDGCSSVCAIQSRHFCQNALTYRSNCSSCFPRCLNCTGIAYCSLCQNTYILSSSNSTCEPNCSIIQGCLACHQNANLTVVCDNCSTGYATSSSICMALCGDAIIKVTFEECDDGNTIDGDGCSSSCIIQYNGICSIVANSSNCSVCAFQQYTNPNHTGCLSCLFDCQTCRNSTACHTCGSASHRIMNTNTSRCQPAPGYYQDNVSYVAPACHSDCHTCNSPSNISCGSCSAVNILQNSSCFSCQHMAGNDCRSCNQSNFTIVCTSCFSGDLTGGRCRVSRSIESNNSQSTLLLVIILPIVGALSCCCIILFCIWRRRKQQEQNKIHNTHQNSSIADATNNSDSYGVNNSHLDAINSHFDSINKSHLAIAQSNQVVKVVGKKERKRRKPIKDDYADRVPIIIEENRVFDMNQLFTTDQKLADSKDQSEQSGNMEEAILPPLIDEDFQTVAPKNSLKRRRRVRVEATNVWQQGFNA